MHFNVPINVVKMIKNAKGTRNVIVINFRENSNSVFFRKVKDSNARCTSYSSLDPTVVTVNRLALG